MTSLARCEPLAVLQSVFLNAQSKGASIPACTAGLVLLHMPPRHPPCVGLRPTAGGVCARRGDVGGCIASPSTVFAGALAGVGFADLTWSERARWCNAVRLITPVTTRALSTEGLASGIVGARRRSPLAHRRVTGDDEGFTREDPALMHRYHARTSVHVV
jgi:hypothetical protein